MEHLELQVLEPLNLEFYAAHFQHRPRISARDSVEDLSFRIERSHREAEACGDNHSNDRVDQPDD